MNHPADQPLTGRGALTRRSLLRLGTLAVLAPPVLAACTPARSAPAQPDVLAPLVASALADVVSANAAARAFPKDGPTFQVVAQVRQTHADALRKEIDRAAATTTTPSVDSTPTSAPPAAPSSAPAAISTLITTLGTDATKAAALAVTVPRYRAGLLGSVSAGCASLAEALGASAPTSAGTDAILPPSAQPSTDPLPADTGDALQKALAAENAALWVCGTASAFLTGTARADLNPASVAHQKRRDDTERIITAGGLHPQPAEPAYTTPALITNTDSALSALAAAESDAEVAWRAVLENTDNAQLRKAGLAGLTGAVLWQTRWRRLADQTPTSIAMPGQPQ